MPVEKDLARGTTETLLLGLLGRKAMYGYEMAREIEVVTGKLLTLKEGTLYPILHRLEQEGYVEAYWEETAEGRNRRYYRLTQRGEAALAKRREQWRQLDGAVKEVLGA